ncbi:MAG: DUF4190 domain-containing protein [Alphaproteobacteria bacterium]
MDTKKVLIVSSIIPNDKTKESIAAVFSLILGVLSFFCFGIITGIPAVILGHIAKFNIKKSNGRLTGNKKATTGIITGYIGFVVFFLLVMYIGIYGPEATNITVNKMKSKDNLRQIYQLLSIYNMDYGSYPTIQPSTTRYEKSGGVRDLFPLYDVGIMKKDQLALLKAPGAKLIDFSNNPTIDEFDKYHIGYTYNSTAKPESNEPLLSEQGVSSGFLQFTTADNGIKPVFKDRVHVILANGKFIKVLADKKNGKLSTKDVKAKQWELLKD